MCLRMRAGSLSTRKGDLLEARGDAVMEPPVAMVSWRRNTAEKVESTAGILGAVTDVLVAAFVDDAMQPAVVHALAAAGEWPVRVEIVTAIGTTTDIRDGGLSSTRPSHTVRSSTSSDQTD